MLFRSRRWGRVPTDIPCPRCRQGTLLAVRSCVQGYCVCDGCGHRFLLSELAPLLSDAAFERLAQAVGDHLSDRV